MDNKAAIDQFDDTAGSGTSAEVGQSAPEGAIPEASISRFEGYARRRLHVSRRRAS